MKAKLKLFSLIIPLITILVLSSSMVEAKPNYKFSINSTYVLSVNDIYDYQWSSDGSKVAYTICPNGQMWTCQLWVSDYKFKNPQLIYTGIDRIYDYQNGWLLVDLNPTQIPGLTEAGQATFRELWKIRDDGSDLTRITSTYTNGIRTQFWNPSYPNMGTVGWAKFIPDTNLIYFSAHDGNGWWQAYTTTNDGTDNWKRMDLYTYSFTIGMSPDGNTLLWGSSWYWNEPTTLYASNNDGSNVHLIASFPVKTSPLVLADENTIILSWPGGEIHAINMDGTNERTVIADGYSNSWADYNPVFNDTFMMLSNRAADGNTHAFEINSDGTNIVQLTFGDYNDAAPEYSPDGSYILYRRTPSSYTSGNPVPTQLVVVDLVLSAIQNLISNIQGLMDMKLLNKGRGNALIVKLQAALRQYSLHDFQIKFNFYYFHHYCHNYKMYRYYHHFYNYNAAIHEMNAFIHNVNAFMRCHKLAQSDGLSLINSANRIINMMNAY